VAKLEIMLDTVALLLHMLLCVADVERRLLNVALDPLTFDATRLEVDVMP